MSEWKEYLLEDVIDKFIDYRGKTPKKTENGIPLITAKVVKNGRILEPNEFISPEDYVSWMTRGFPEIDDIVLTTEAPLGEIALIKDPNVALAQRIITIRGKKECVYNPFLKYYFQNSNGQFELQSRASGTTVFGIKAAVLKKVPVLLPPLPEQYAIASVLSCLDDKIDLLHRQSKTLEALAEALFRRWFVEEAEEEWEERRLENLCTITRGASPRPIIKYVVNGTVPWIKIADGSRCNSFFIDSTNEFIIEEGVQKSVKVFPGDLILSNSATCGFPYFVELEGCIHDGWLLFRDFHNVSKYFVFFFLKQIFRELNSIADDNLNTGMLKEYPVKVPPASLIKDFEDQVITLVNRIKSNIYQCRTLEKLRDTLLPKLMSGEVRVAV
jgi:type I restriction enzyme, S subunit